jgi:hypothetical protein
VDLTDNYLSSRLCINTQSFPCASDGDLTGLPFPVHRKTRYGARLATTYRPSVHFVYSRLTNACRPLRCATSNPYCHLALPSRILACEESEDRLGEDFGHLIRKRPEQREAARDDAERKAFGIINRAIRG